MSRPDLNRQEMDSLKVWQLNFVAPFGKALLVVTTSSEGRNLSFSASFVFKNTKKIFEVS
jgi:hypothetical protein